MLLITSTNRYTLERHQYALGQLKPDLIRGATLVPHSGL